MESSDSAALRGVEKDDAEAGVSRSFENDAEAQGSGRFENDAEAQGSRGFKNDAVAQGSGRFENDGEARDPGGVDGDVLRASGSLRTSRDEKVEGLRAETHVIHSEGEPEPAVADGDKSNVDVTSQSKVNHDGRPIRETRGSTGLSSGGCSGNTPVPAATGAGDSQGGRYAEVWIERSGMDPLVLDFFEAVRQGHVAQPPFMTYNRWTRWRKVEGLRHPNPMKYHGLSKKEYSRLEWELYCRVVGRCHGQEKLHTLMERHPEGMISDNEGEEGRQAQGAQPDRGAKRPAPGSRGSAPGCISPAVSVGCALKAPPPQLLICDLEGQAW